MYIPQLIAQQGVDGFDAQAIPTNISLLGVENYKAFLIERRKRIAARLNQFLSVEDSRKNPVAAERDSWVAAAE